MDPITTAIDEAYEMAERHRKKGKHLLSASYFEGAFNELDGWREHYEQRILHYLSAWRPDRDETEKRMRKQWATIESKVDVGDVFETWQDMAQDELKGELIADGLPPDSAAKMQKVYSIACYDT